MAMVCKFRKPDFFLTVTCNTTQSEILNCIEGVQRPEGRTEVIVCIYYEIKRTFRRFIMEYFELFGPLFM